MEKVKKRISEKLSRRSEISKDRRFDVEFWQKLGPEAIFAASWEMIDEVNLIRGKNADKSRLQRSVQNIKRRSR